MPNKKVMNQQRHQNIKPRSPTSKRKESPKLKTDKIKGKKLSNT